MHKNKVIKIHNNAEKNYNEVIKLLENLTTSTDYNIISIKINNNKDYKFLASASLIQELINSLKYCIEQL